MRLAGDRFGSDETITTEDVPGAEADLTAGLRPWLLAYLNNGCHGNGWYIAFLVATTETGAYDTYDSLAAEDVIWYFDEECAPLSAIR
ncbi:MAG: hypothetical protein GEV28_32860 [Actinophytocola sp.]|uniref:hypothetical protein n=1 Tax=Actinophytocola sp. TaxID=1872138 RepID=UPI001320CAA0|nr:hypothetical protein [Actinophytocola sp.]MPZ84919.1 hypothetical protein [Actinophytocola sp.]